MSDSARLQVEFHVTLQLLLTLIRDHFKCLILILQEEASALRHKE